MTPAQAAELLALAGAFDRRTVGRADAIAWADALTDLDPADCADAIRAHFRESTEYLMPAHVRQGVRKIRAERIRAANSALLEPDDVDPNDVPAYLAAARARRHAIADGQALQPQTVPHSPEGIERVEQLAKKTIAALPKMPPAKPMTGKR